MSSIDQKTRNLKNNLVVQINKIFKNTREGGYKTRARYMEACMRFAGFLASEFRLQKFSNVKGKHIIAYVKHMQSEGKSPSTIKTDLSGIRYAHRKSGGRYRLPDNEKLNLDKRIYGIVDKAWTQQEIQMAKDLAKIQGRYDVYHAINISSNMGTRLEGTVKVTVSHLREALKYKELYAKEKGGLERYIPITRIEQVNAIKEALAYAKSLGKSGQDKLLVSSIKGGVKKEYKSIQNWVYNNQKHFRNDSIRSKKTFETFKQQAEKHGYKPRSKSLNFHGLRYAYAQDRYSELRKKGYNDYMAKKITSENMGHHRTDVLNIYLNKK